MGVTPAAARLCFGTAVDLVCCASAYCCCMCYKPSHSVALTCWWSYVLYNLPALVSLHVCACAPRCVT